MKPTSGIPALLLIAAALPLTAQTEFLGPAVPGQAAGDPRSSYAQGSVDNVNLYNGSLTVAIPVLGIGGRGDAGYTLTLPVQRHWNVVGPIPGGNTQAAPYTWNDPWQQVDYQGSPYSPGGLVFRRTSTAPDVYDCNGTHYGSGPYVTRAVWIAPDATESLLLDTVSGGNPQQPQNVPLPGSGPPPTCEELAAAQVLSRGQIFASADSSGMVFVASTAVADSPITSGSPSADPLFVSGTLYFRNGTKYQINRHGKVTQIEDRNGNFTNICYTPEPSGDPSCPSLLGNLGESYTATDPLGRTFTVQSSVNSIPPSGFPSRTNDIISYLGAGGGNCQSSPAVNCHTVNVNYAALSNSAVEASGYTAQSLQSLFPTLGGSSSGSFNTTVVSSVVLPDNSQYSFQYNSYGELARMTLPTGAYYTYNYQQANGCYGGGTGVIAISAAPNYSIYRRLTERDEYANGGTTRTAVIRYTPCAGHADPNNNSWATTTTEVDYYAGDGATLLRKEMHYFYGDPSSSSSVPAPAGYANWNDGLEFRTDVINATTGSTLQTSQAIWAQRPCATVSPVTGQQEVCYTPSLGNPASEAGPAHDPVVCATTTSLDGSGLAGSLFNYDQYNNPVHQYEYNFGSAPAIAGANPCPSAATYPGYFRQTDTQYTYFTTYNSGGSGAGLNLWNLPQQITITDTPHGTQSIHILGYDQSGLQNDQPATGYDSLQTGPRGNVTSDTRVLSGTNLTHSYKYDLVGNIVQDQDEVGNTNVFGYADTNNTYANLTSITLGSGSSSPLSASLAYDYSTSKLTDVTDPNNVTTAYSYQQSGVADPFDRLLTVDRGIVSGGTTMAVTSYQYPSLTTTYRFDDQLSAGDGALQAYFFSDGLSRPIYEYDYENVSAGQYILTCRTYDGLGRVSVIPNPVRGYSSCQAAIGAGAAASTFTWDSLNRATLVTLPDQTTQTAVYLGTLTGETATVTDQASVAKTVTVDSAGRVMTVVEDPGTISHLNYQTSYTWNHLDELLSVIQGAQQRTFAYDTLGRLQTSTQPEANGQQLTYAYYNNGTLNTRTDPNGVVATYNYDSLNRLIQISYSAASPPSTYTSTPSVFYTYDDPSVPYSKGRQTAVAYGVSRTSTANNTFAYSSYDPLGRVLTSSETIAGGNPYPFSYTWFASGALASEAYPSGRTISQTYDGNNRPLTLSGVAFAGAPSTSYLSSMNYCAHGGLQSFLAGNSLSRGFSYNTRLQPTEVAEGGGATSSSDCSTVSSSSPLLDMKFFWGTGSTQTASNSGLLRSHQVVTGSQSGATSALNVQQVFGYDNANRITSFSDNGSGTVLARNYAYTGNTDNGQFGNVYISSNATGLPVSPINVPDATAYNPATNRLNAIDPNSSLRAAYDNNGNLTSIGVGASVTYAFNYDAENRQTVVTSGSSTIQYAYDGEGRRVQATSSGGTTSFIYDAFGQLIAEYASSGGPPPCTTCYLSLDHLGSTRMVTDQNGNAVSRHDYAPFGDELISGFAGRGNLWGAADPARQRFTGAEQDDQDVNFFQARYYLAPQGRFNSPDPVNFGADTLNPQSWNGFAYVVNSPLSAVDPTGLASDCGNFCVTPPGGSTVGSGDGSGSGGGSLTLFGSGGGGGKGTEVNPGGGPLNIWNSLQWVRPSALESAVPVVGNLDNAIYNFHIGKWGWGTVYAGLAASDLAVAKDLVTIPGKLTISELSKIGAANGTTMFSREIGSTGPGATTELLHMIRAHGRTITTATEGSEELRFLDTMGAEASVGGPLHLNIILRENPSRAAAMEEFLHGTQDRLGIIDRLGVEGAENHVTDFMTRHSRLLGLEPQP